MTGVMRLSSRILCAALFGAFLLLAPHAASADTLLNGYTFSDDSMDLHENPFFSEYDRGVDFLTSLYGYGDFIGYALSQTKHQDFALDGIDCVVIREDIEIPLYDETSPDVDVHNIYYYYAKDTDDNIHVLQMVYYSGEDSLGWNYSNLPEGGTTLKYPAAPTTGQDVFFGYVDETGKQVGDFHGCVTIINEDLPWTDESITEYLIPVSGVLALSYNQGGGINGYSVDGVAPEYAEEEESTWEEWLDDNCFISACSP